MFYQLIQIGSIIPGFFPGVLGGLDTSTGIAGLFFGAAGAMTIGLGIVSGWGGWAGGGVR